MTALALDPATIRAGEVRGRYYRENFAQGGIDLVQILPELVTNADAAIAAAGRAHGRIDLRIGAPDPDFLGRWRAALRPLKVPALMTWRYEIRCADDGEGVDAAAVDRRLGALGVEPPRAGQRGLFGRGLRDVWLAQGAGRIEGVRGGRLVESWFFPARGEGPYAYVHVRDEPATDGHRRALGLGHAGTRVTVPLALERLPPAGRLRTLVATLVQLRPVLEDPARQLWLELPGSAPALVTAPEPEPDPERPVLLERELDLGGGVTAQVVVRRAAEPLSLGFSRATRRSGLVIRSGRAAHEATLAGLEGRPGARHLYGEVRCDALDVLQRDALDSPRPQVVVRVDRGGLNEHHPIVRRLYAAIDTALRPIVEDEERRAGAHLRSATRTVRARDEAGLRALNDALRTAFDAPGSAGFARGGAPAAQPAVTTSDDPAAPLAPGGPPDAAQPATPAGTADPAMRFKRSPIRLHPGERRGISLLFDPDRIPTGTPIAVESDGGLHAALATGEVPEPGTHGYARVSGTVRARVSVEPGQRLGVLAVAGDHEAELEVLVVRHTGTGWVREIARKDEDAVVEALFDPESGTVTVYEGRREFRELERAARRAGLTRRRAAEYVPFRMLEVEAAANAVYRWAAEHVLDRRLPHERPADPAEYAAAVGHEAQVLRHRVHARLMQAFLDPEVFEGAVPPAGPRARRSAERQLRLDGVGGAGA